MFSRVGCIRGVTNAKVTHAPTRAHALHLGHFRYEHANTEIVNATFGTPNNHIAPMCHRAFSPCAVPTKSRLIMDVLGAPRFALTSRNAPRFAERILLAPFIAPLVFLLRVHLFALRVLGVAMVAT